MKRKIIGLLLVLVFLIGMMPQMVFADGENDPVKAKRTVLLYVCGADLETDAGMATYNLKQVLKAKFSADDDIKFIIMTGGSKKWQLDDDNDPNNENGYLADPAAGAENQPKQISGEYNQIWEARGADAKKDGADDPNAGKMVLLDGDGITGEGPVLSKDELMSDPETLKAFINYGVENYPAEKYDLILWDHGGGPTSGFAVDEHEVVENEYLDSRTLMSFPKIIDALSDNKVVDTDSDGEPDAKFDFVDFDACLMNSVELDLALADFMDYYIASPETEPGYGQYYTGWLDELGDPTKDDIYNREGGTFELGMKIVDDFKEFYENGDGKGQSGTLAIIDMNKMMDSKTGFIAALKSLNGALKDQARVVHGESSFYDEFNSIRNSIMYGGMDYFDLGNFASLLSVVNMEVKPAEEINLNAYYEIGPRISNILQPYNKEDPADPNNEKAFIYTCGTEKIKTAEQLYRKADGEIVYGSQGTSGIYLFFPGSGPDGFVTYNNEMKEVIGMLPEGEIKEYLDDYRRVLIDYTLISKCGNDVDWLVNYGGMDKDDIDYAAVKARWQEDMDDPFLSQYCDWNRMTKDLIEESDEKKEAGNTEKWLETIIRQQADEAIDPDDVTAKEVKTKNGKGYEVTINNSRKRVIDSVSWAVNIEMPVFNKYVEEHFDASMQSVIENFGEIPLGRVNGVEDISDKPTDTDSPGYNFELMNWYNKTTTVWNLAPIEEKWYVVKDAEGKEHVAAYEIDADGTGILPVTVGVGEQNQLLLLFFKDDELTEVYFLDQNTGWRPVKVKDLQGELEVMPINYINIFGLIQFYIPISESTFTLSADNASSIKMLYKDIDEIDEIGDVDGDGRKVSTSAKINDFYGYSIDITDKIMNPADQLIDIDFARVRPAIYNNGDSVSLEVVYRDEVLEEGKNYVLTPIPEDAEYKKLGDGYKVGLTGIGKFRGYAEKEFSIIYSEDAAKAAIQKAEEYVSAAQNRVDALTEESPASDVEYAYQALVAAQNALVDAKNELLRTKDALSKDEQARLQEKIDDLKEDVEQLTEDLAAASYVDISNFAVTMKTSFEYTGDMIEPEVSVAGLKPGDYKVEYDNNKLIGTATVYITGVSSRKFKGEIIKEFEITKRTNVVDGKGKTAKVKFKKLKKKTQKLKLSKVVKITKRGKGTLAYKKVSGNKKITVNKKTGKITIKKKLKKGTYKVKVKFMAKGDSIYKASAWKTVTFKIKVK